MEDEDLDALLDNLSDDDDDYNSAPGGFLGAIDEEEDVLTDRFADIDTSLVYDVDESKIIYAGGVVAATRTIGTTDQATQLANIRRLESTEDQSRVKRAIASEAETNLLSLQKQRNDAEDECKRLLDNGKDATSCQESINKLNEEIGQERQVFIHAKREADEFDVALHALRLEIGGDVDLQKQTQAENATRARHLSSKKHKMDGQHSTRLTRLQEEASARASAARAKYDGQRDVTKKNMREVNSRVASINKDHALQIRSAQSKLDKRQQKRVNAAKALKNSIGKKLAKIATKNFENQVQEKARQKREKAAHDGLLQEGINPYLHFRRKRLKEKTLQEREKTLNKIADKKMKIMNEMLDDDDFQRKRLSKQHQEEAYENIYRKSLGRREREKKVEEYLKRNTKDGQDMVDPTGRTFRLDASKLTTIKTARFGLGRATADSLAAIAQKKVHKKVKPHHRLLLKDNISSEKAGSTSRTRGGGFGSGDGDGDTVSAAAVYGKAMAAMFNSEPVGELGGDNVMSGPAARSSKGPDTTGGGKLQTRKLSVFEQKAMARALERQRTNIVQKQVVWGKEFKGRAFLSQPAVVHFKDFVVGTKMKLTFRLTNVSNTFNNFRLNDLPDTIKDFFTIKYTRPGRMSAGMECAIHIFFKPKIAKDIQAEIPFLGKTGPFTVPLICTCKKAKPVLSTDEVIMDNVVRGETEKFTLTITNKGALPTDFTITAMDPDAFAMVADELSFASSGSVQTYNETKVVFTYKPMKEAEHLLELLVKYSDPNCEDVSLLLRVGSCKVPIFVEKEVMDFRCCVIGKLYRSNLVLCNRGKLALKCALPFNRMLGDALQYNPDVGFVQGRDPRTREPGRFSVQLKFLPTENLLQTCKDYMDENYVLSVPVTINVPSQSLPVTFTFRAKLDFAKLSFEPKAIDFGRALITQANSMPLRVTNHSALPQKVSFVRLPDQIRVAPDDGLAIILPGETFVFHVILSLQSAVKRALTLTLRSSLGKEYTIKCVGMGVESPLRVSHTVVDFAPIPVGDKVDQSVFITNTSKKTKFWEAIIPGKEVSHLHISPLVGELAPGATQRVEIEFVPVEPPAEEPEQVQPLEGEEEKEEVEDEPAEKETKGSTKKKKPKKSKSKSKINTKKPAKKGKGKAAKSGEVEDKAPEEPPPTPDEAETKSEGETKIEAKTEEVIGDEDEDKDFPLGSLRCSKPEEPPSRHGRWYMPIFCKGSGPVEAERGVGAQFVEIRTTTVQRVLSVSKHRVDFSQVAVGKMEVVQLSLRNLGRHLEEVVAEPLNPMGPFRLVNAVRSLPAKSAHNLSIEFAPRGQMNYCETLLLRSKRGRVSVILVGQGVSPALVMDPEDGQLPHMHICAGCTMTQTVKLSNTSIFPLPIRIYPTKTQSSNFSNFDVFDCTPSTAIIPANASLDVEITFSSDHEERFSTDYIVEIPASDDATEHIISVKGWCWSRQGYAVAVGRDTAGENNDPVVPEDVFTIPPALLGGAEPNALLLPTLQPARRIVLEFSPTDGITQVSEEDKSMSRQLIVGCVDPKGSTIKAAAASNGQTAFELSWLEAGDASKFFSFDTPKGVLPPDKEAIITMTFHPKDVEEPESGVPLRVPQWIEATVACALTGGYAPPGAPETEIVHVVLRAHGIMAS